MKSYTEWEYERGNLNSKKSESKDKTKGKTRRNWEISRKVSKEYLSDNENQRKKSTDRERGGYERGENRGGLWG